MTSRKRVLVTGAGGLIGRLLIDRLGDRYDMLALTRTPSGFPDGIANLLGDITDLDAMLRVTEGVDAIVHMAGDPRVSAPWEDALRGNVVGTYNVLEASRRNGVGAVIYASSNHAVGWWEADQGPDLYALDDDRQIDENVPFQPDSLYGWSKAAAETLGRYYSDVHGVRFFALRIGWVLRDDDPATQDVSGEVAPPLTAEQVRLRLRAIYLSHRDCAELVRCCLDADHIRFGVYYGISDNPRKFYDLSNAREEIGYEPRDSAPIG